MTSFGSYNLFDYGRIPDSERERRVRAVVEALDVDVLAVQEIYGRTPSEAAARLIELAESVGMSAYVVTPPRDERDVALGFGNNHLHVGLMWRPDRVSPVPGTCRSYRTLFWHSLVKVTLLVPGDDGTRHAIQHAAYHAGPFGQPLRVAEAERVVSALTRPADRPAGLVAADWNSVSADRATSGDYFDPDPYERTSWRPGYVYQCEWGRDAGKLSWWRANRQPTEVLYAAGLLDAVVALNNTTPDSVVWEPTAGHWPGDPFPPRRIDAIRVTSELVPTLRSCTVPSAPSAGETAPGARVDPRTVSDHLPVKLVYEPARLPTGARPDTSAAAP